MLPSTCPSSLRIQKCNDGCARARPFIGLGRSGIRATVQRKLQVEIQYAGLDTRESIDDCSEW